MIETNRSIELTDAAKDFIADVGMDPTNGARPLRRELQRRIEDPIAEDILAGKWPAGSIIQADVAVSEKDDKEKEVVFSSIEGEIPEPKKHESIARKTERLMTDFDLDDTSKAIPVKGAGDDDDDKDDEKEEDLVA